LLLLQLWLGLLLLIISLLLGRNIIFLGNLFFISPFIFATCVSSSYVDSECIKMEEGDDPLGSSFVGFFLASSFSLSSSTILPMV
jgi:hypothetical protein